MKIYNKVVINLSTDQTVFEDSFEYGGDIVECKGGGGSQTTNTYDPTYNAGMLKLSQEQQTWARQMYNVFQSGINPGDTSEMQYMQNIVNANQSLMSGQTGLEREKIAAERGLLPGMTSLSKERIASERGLLPGMTALSGEKIASERELLPGQTALSKAQTGDTMSYLSERAPVRAKFFQDSLTGVDVGERMRLGQADVAHSFAGAERDARANAARMGQNPANIDFSGLATNKAKAIGTARTTARVGAKDESFRRLGAAMNY